MVKVSESAAKFFRTKNLYQTLLRTKNTSNIASNKVTLIERYSNKVTLIQRYSNQEILIKQWNPLVISFDFAKDGFRSKVNFGLAKKTRRFPSETLR